MDALGANLRTRSQGRARAPSTGRLRRWLGPFYFTGVFWHRFALVAPRIVPGFLRGPVVIVFAGFFFLALGRVRRALGSNLEAVLGPCGQLERAVRAWRTIQNHGWALCERYERFVSGIDFEVSVENEAQWTSLTASGRGAVLVTAHVGMWELGSALPATHERRTIHVVRDQEPDPRTQALVRSLLARLAGPNGRHYVTHFGDSDPSLGMRLLGHLRDGEMVALQGDRPSDGGQVFAGELLGRPFCFPLGPAALARAAGVPLVPVFAFREGRRRYRLVFRPAIELPSRASGRAGLEQATEALAREIEWAIRTRPHQWFCFAELWR